MILRRALPEDAAPLAVAGLAAWRRGIGGRALLEAVENVVRNRGFPSVRLEVTAVSDGALALYRRRGFEVTWQGLQHDKVLETDLHKTHLRKTLADQRPG